MLLKIEGDGGRCDLMAALHLSAIGCSGLFSGSRDTRCTPSKKAHRNCVPQKQVVRLQSVGPSRPRCFSFLEYLLIAKVMHNID